MKLQKVSLFWLILAAVFAGSAAPLIVAALTDRFWAGVVTLALVGSVLSFRLALFLTHPIIELAQTARQIRQGMDHEEWNSSAFADVADRCRVEEIGVLAADLTAMAQAWEERRHELNSIYAMGQAITSSLDTRKTLQAILAAVGQVVHFDAAEVCIPRGGVLVVEAWQGGPDYNDMTGWEYRFGFGPTGMIVNAQDAVFMPIVAEVEADTQRALGYGMTGGEFSARSNTAAINSFLGIPLRIGDRLIGTITLIHHTAGHFTDADRRKLSKLAAQASIAIDNAQRVHQRDSAVHF